MPRARGWTGEADVGAGWVSESSLKFGDYRGLEEEGGFTEGAEKADWGLSLTLGYSF